MENKNFYLALSVLMGTIIGVGIFALPYIFSKSGFLIGAFWLLFLGFIVMLVHLLYGEVVLRTQEKHRLIGYAQKYLGAKFKKLVYLSVIFGSYGALLAYFIVGGNFLHLLLKDWFGGSEAFYIFIVFLISAVFVWRGIKLVAAGELIMTIFLLVAVALILLKSFNHINVANFLNSDFKNLFLPYGVVLFSLSGAVAIPELIGLLKEKQKSFKVIIWGSFIPVFIYLLFVIAVLGVTGSQTSPEALSGLSASLQDGIIKIGIIFGFFAVITSIFIIGLALKQSFVYDLKFPHWLAFLLAVFPPLLGIVLGLKDYVEIIGKVGAIFGGVDGIAIALIWRRAKKIGQRLPEYNLKLPKSVIYFIIAVFILGILYNLVYF